MESFNGYPSKNFFIGYEVMMTMGKLLNRFGNLFQFDPGINSFIDGEIFQGTSYGSENSNQHVPIVRFENAELVLVNPK